ncbi:MAG: BREX-1 system adenine-specific DNA-methyltransferase PglX [Candidatus Obscuribacterales bacterium]|nr:BREX-1 system adenine-specific DNA-methyltransferase PglX [Candidatus Obscuribacterales bacterium]
MKLSEHVDKIRDLIESSFDKDFARLGIGKNKKLEIEKLPEKFRSKRLRFEKMLESHIGETGNYESAREKLMDELTFTHFNRLAALKVMEAANLLPPVITKQPEHGDRSFGHKSWLEIRPNMRSEELDGIREYVKYAFDELGQTLPLYSRSHSYALLPDAISLNDIIDAFNAVEKDQQVGSDIWLSDDVLGWMYESYNNRKKQLHKDSKAKTEFNKVSLQSQVYTPRWVVQFLVENSLGKLYLEMYPSSQIRSRYKIANAPTKQELSPKPVHELKVIDPACGSGNFLLYSFDFLYELYLDQVENFGADYEAKDIPKLIIEGNLHGIDLDDRAVQLAQLGLFIKGKKKSRSIAHLSFNLVSSDFFLPNYSEVRHIFVEGSNLDQNQQNLIEDIWTDLQLAYKFGSLIRLDEKLKSRLRALEQQFGAKQQTLFTSAFLEQERKFITSFLQNLKTAVEQHAKSDGNSFLSTKARDAIIFLDLLTTEYDVATTNPPYTDSADFGPELKEFIENNYKKPYKFHTNLYASFIKRCFELTGDKGKIAMIHPHTFMFIKTFEDVRKFIIEKSCVEILVDFGLDRVNLFGPGILLDATFYVVSKRFTDNAKGIYFNLTTNLQEKLKKARFLEALDNYLANIPDSRVYNLRQTKLRIIDAWPFIYWISDDFRSKFKGDSVKDILKNCQGVATANNHRFLRFWWELSDKDRDICRDDWVYYAKGGPYKKWSGNLWLMLNWKSNGTELKNYKDDKGKQRSCIRNEEVFFRPGVTYSASGSKGPSYRLLPEGCIFDTGGSSIFPLNKYRNNEYILAFFNTKLSSYIMGCLNPTVNKQVGDIERVPFVIPSAKIEQRVVQLSLQNVKLTTEIDSSNIYEPSFVRSPLEMNRKLDWKSSALAYLNYENLLVAQVLLNEAIINCEIFELYNLTEQDRSMVLAKEGESIGGLPVCSEARQAYLSQDSKAFPLDNIRKFIDELPSKTFAIDEVDSIKSEFATLYQTNNDLEEFCIRLQINPINVWYWFKQSNLLPVQKGQTLAKDFLVDVIREILSEDEDGIIPLVPNAGEKMMVDRIEEKFQQKGFSTAQYSSFESIIGSPINTYLSNSFFADLTERLNLFMYQPKTPFIWHLSSGPEQGLDCFVLVYKWSRDKLLRLRAVYIEHRERSLVNRQSDLVNNDSAEAQNEKDRIFKQLKEIENFKAIIDELLSEEYSPRLDDGIAKNIAPLQKKKMIPYQVLNPEQLKKYLNADW